MTIPQNPPSVLALDLEGTLISNAMSQFPRPGLAPFIDFCMARFERVVVYTAISSARARNVLNQLHRDGYISQQFAHVEIVAWTGPVKDLRLISGLGEAHWETALLVDDLESYIAPDQHHRWVPIAPWPTPYSDDDRELERVQRVLESHLQA